MALDGVGDEIDEQGAAMMAIRPGPRRSY